MSCVLTNRFLFLKTLGAIGALLMVGAAFAISSTARADDKFFSDDDDDIKPDDSTQKPAQTLEERARERVIRFRSGSNRIQPNGACEQLLIATQLKLNRTLTFKQIKELLPRLLSATGEDLISAKEWLNEPGGVAVGTMVLTPTGYVPIETLKAGDVIVSANLKTEFLRKNQIAMVFHSASAYMTRLENPVWVQQPEMTDNCLVFRASRKDQIVASPVRAVNTHREIASLCLLGPDHSVGTVAMGPLGDRTPSDPSRGQSPIVNLVMRDGQFNNFYVGGVLVMGLNPANRSDIQKWTLQK